MNQKPRQQNDVIVAGAVYLDLNLIGQVPLDNVTRGVRNFKL